MCLVRRCKVVGKEVQDYASCCVIVRIRAFHHLGCDFRTKTLNGADWTGLTPFHPFIYVLTIRLLCTPCL